MIISPKTFLLAAILSGGATLLQEGAVKDAPEVWIGYTAYQTTLPTRFDNQITSRAHLVRADGSDNREVAGELIDGPNQWTQFAGWSPDGTTAVIHAGWESPENGAWEEENKTFRMTEGWKLDAYFHELKSGSLHNLSAVERVSDYNAGIVFVPGGSGELMFTALIDGISHPFLMNRDGTNKRDISQGEAGFIYGVSASPDGRYVAYHENYQIKVADADGGNQRAIDTGNPFNFAPQWSPDGGWLLFVSGEHYNCHPTIVRPDGSDLRKLADRGGYEGVTTVYDVYDFHGGSSDVPVWSTDGSYVYYTAKLGESIELMTVTLDGSITQLTHSEPGVTHYHPKPSPDGKWLAFGSTRSGTRQLYVMPARGGKAWPITKVPEGHGAMWALWQPATP